MKESYGTLSQTVNALRVVGYTMDFNILYAISSIKFDVKGLLVNRYGISADAATDVIIAKLKTHPEEPASTTFD